VRDLFSGDACSSFVLDSVMLSKDVVFESDFGDTTTGRDSYLEVLPFLLLFIISNMLMPVN
jgi:hypothetical protein